jgi:hypothetical protein
MNIIAPLMIILTIIAITNLNKRVYGDREKIKNYHEYNFKRDFLGDNMKLVILISLTIYFVLKDIFG